MDGYGALSVLSRFLHIASVAGLVGGVLYARLALVPSLALFPERERIQAGREAQAKFRSVLFVMLILAVASGLYNFLGPSAPHHGKQWQIWFGIKMLAVLHFLAVSIVWATSPYGDVPTEAKSKRRLTSLVISGFIAILIADYLRYLTAQGG
jgi:hypothetical protein